MNALLRLANSLPLPGGSSFICGSIGDCLMTVLQVALAVWIVFATLGAIVDIAVRRKGSATQPDCANNQEGTKPGPHLSWRRNADS